MQDKQVKTVLIMGCGYIGRRVAGLLLPQNYRVTGCVRSKGSAAALNGSGITVVSVDLDCTVEKTGHLRGFDEVFYFVPPPAHGELDPRMRAFLQMLDIETSPRRMVYISTSAVYGDCKGAWISESQPVNPVADRGKRRLDAERQLTAWCDTHATQWIVLRVPGIYGPGKLPLARLRKGTPVLREEDSPYTNRIHADDLTRICIAAMQGTHTNTVYNVSDGQPGNMTDYFFRIADAAGLPRPPTVTREEAPQLLSPGMLSFLRDSRRMRNDKLLDELGISLQFPNLATGLEACFSR